MKDKTKNKGTIYNPDVKKTRGSGNYQWIDFQWIDSTVAEGTEADIAGFKAGRNIKK